MNLIKILFYRLYLSHIMWMTKPSHVEFFLRYKIFTVFIKDEDKKYLIEYVEKNKKE